MSRVSQNLKDSIQNAETYGEILASAATTGTAAKLLSSCRESADRTVVREYRDLHGSVRCNTQIDSSCRKPLLGPVSRADQARC